MASPADRGDLLEQQAGSPGLTVVSLIPSKAEAEAVVRDLKQAGFTDQEIGIAMQDPNGQLGIGEDRGPQSADPAAAAVNGGLVGGLIGLLGSLLIPGLGPVVLGGVLASTLTGVGVGAATGGLISLLVGLGVSESDAERFDRGLRAGGILLTVSAAERAPEARAIIQQHRSEPRNRRYRDDPGYSGPERRLLNV